MAMDSKDGEMMSEPEIRTEEKAATAPTPSTGNGKKRRRGRPKKQEVPTEIQLEQEDMLRLEVITEKSRRLGAEKARIEAEEKGLGTENQLFVVELGKKYGVDFSNYSIGLDDGIARKRDA